MSVPWVWSRDVLLLWGGGFKGMPAVLAYCGGVRGVCGGDEGGGHYFLGGGSALVFLDVVEASGA